MKFRVFVMTVAASAVAGIASAQDATTVPLNLKLPAPAFMGTPSDLQVGPNVEKPTGKPRPPMMVPAGLTNLALGKTVTCSSTNVDAAKLQKLTDGDKEAREASLLLLRKGVQWVQVDLGAVSELYAMVVWHNHDAFKIYHGVVAEVADDEAFTKNVKVIFNNDIANLDGLGAGTDKEYFESNEGKLIDAKGVKARYVRLYSDGSTESKLNEYLEIEVYGKPSA